MEMGYFRNLHNNLHVYLRFETNPVWLSILESINGVPIHFLDTPNKDDLLARLSADHHLHPWLLNSLPSDRLLFGSTTAHTLSSSITTHESLVLISGSLSFLSEHCERFHHNRTIGILDTHFQGRLRNNRPSGTFLSATNSVRWTRLRHLDVGGLSDYVALVVTAHLPRPPITSTLRRTIADVFDHTIRPRPAAALSSPSFTTGDASYSLDSILRQGAYDLPVFHYTEFYSTKRGVRSLTLKELGIAHGLPRQQAAIISCRDLSFPPLQLLSAVLLSALEQIAPEMPVSHGPPRIPVPPVTPSPTQSWLPLINRFLSHEWLDESLRARGVPKHDAALAPSHLWDARLLLLYPQASLSHLTVLRNWLLTRLRRRLYCELRRYLSTHYSTAAHPWAQRLVLGRQLRCPKFRGKGGRNEGPKDTTHPTKLSSDTIVLNNNLALDSRCFNNSQSSHSVCSENSEDSSIFSSGSTDTIITNNTGATTLVKEAGIGCDILHKLCHCTWWEWDLGSTLIFWRWPGHSKIWARDGFSPFVTGDLPKWRKPSKTPPPEKFDLILDKIRTIVDRGYVAPGYVSSLTDYFDVPKGEQDIRMVYNGSSCGLNASLWAPKFWLPFPKSAIRLLDFGMYMANLDLGEMFLNFPLHESLQEYSGIDLTPFRHQLGLVNSASPWYRWTRNWMGAKPSPYASVRFYYLCEEFVRGNHQDEANSLRWDRIILNLPGSSGYNPSKTRVRKWDDLAQGPAGDIISFVDDCRASGRSIEHTWAITRQVAGRFQYRGVQDASRKRDSPSQSPGPWAGAVMSTAGHSITKTVELKKWLKGRKIVNDLWDKMTLAERWEDSNLNYKELEVARGFLGHLSMTYEILVPYLKGFHLALAAHLDKRDTEGWKLSDASWRDHIASQVLEGLLEEEEAEIMQEGKPYSPHDHPTHIRPLKQLHDDLFALKQYFEIDEPPIIHDRCQTVTVIRYGFGDASGRGFGSTVQTRLGLRYRIGIWGSQDETESSNFKELENVVSTIEEEASTGDLKNSVLYFFTDNSTVEAALSKGNSTSKKLFGLVVRFRMIQFRLGNQVVVSHVSGKRMIAQGTDGVSRGNLVEGVGSGLDIMSFIPLHLDVLARHPPIKSWLLSWLTPNVEFLSPDQWYTRGHDHKGGSRDQLGFWHANIVPGTFVWTPAPASAEVALEELRKALIKRQESTHLFVCPRLLTTEWQRQLHKSCDVVVTIKAGAIEDGWPSDMLEPLTLGFVFPHLLCKPWQRRSTPQMLFMARELSGLRDEPGVDPRGKSESGTTTSEERERLDLVWATRHRPSTDFKHARDGDHLLVPFECDGCVFKKLRGYSPPDPIVLQKDLILVATIRRANLDAFWSRASSTVRANRNKVKLSIELSESMGLLSPYEQSSFLPAHDYCGMEIALQMLQASRRPGRHSDEYTQFDTIRQLRTAYSNFHKSSTQHNQRVLALSDDSGMAQRLVSDPCSSLWFSRFVAGCRLRMGQDWRPNKAFSVDLILEVIKGAEGKLREARVNAEIEMEWLTFGTFLTLSYVLSLRGNEGLLLDLDGLNTFEEQGGCSEGHLYFIVPLLGEVKGERGNHRCHLFPCVTVTSSGIQVYNWVKELLEKKRENGHTSGPAISSIQTNLRTTGQLDEQLIELLEEVYDRDPALFPVSIQSKDDINKSYSVFRSPRRSSTTRAVESNVSSSDIDNVNRWASNEKAKGKLPSRKMRQHYTQVELLLKPFIRYTHAM